MSGLTPPQPGRSVAVALFEREPQARQAVQAVLALGVDERAVGLLAPGSSPTVTSDVARLLAVAAVDGGDITTVLASLGVPEGEARFYAQETSSGRSIVVVEAGSSFEAVRDALLRHGGDDVQSRGRELARGDGAGVVGGSGPRPIDLTGSWEDVASRYETLWRQHYGTSDATWEPMAPVYTFGWYEANDTRYRGRRWAEVEGAVRRDWEAAARADGGSGLAGREWSDVAGPLRDVWEDVADEATTGAEGGADRRIPRQGSDQLIPAREVRPPTREVPQNRRFP